MFVNSSPWLFQLNRVRPISFLIDDTKTNIAIIGGGIAGVTTAYFLLKYTKKDVMLLEVHKVAHGATGHNAGQIASYFEKPFVDIVQEFGLELAIDGQRAVESAWRLLEDIYADVKIETPFSQFSGYAGCGSLEEIMYHLQDIAYQKQSGGSREEMLIAQEAKCLKDIPKEYKDCYTRVPQSDILSLLETNNRHYIATLVKRKGCLNSALFTEELVGYLLNTYKNRFTLAEHTPVDQLILHEKSALLSIESQKKFVVARHVVLCTNGFEKISIVNASGETDIDAKFHHLVQGSIGYMAGYLEKGSEPPIAISYLPDSFENGDSAQEADPYFYLTRRPFENEKKEKHNLVCVGGPEFLLDDTTAYSKEDHPYPQEAQRSIDSFLHTNYKYAPKHISYKFRWHGLMGYTPNGIRCIGFEPCNSVLLYNLGCNGVGILPSIYGGKRISQLLQGKKLKKSIFDPQDKKCVLKNSLVSKKKPRTQKKKVL